jgi:hypothetical protein
MTEPLRTDQARADFLQDLDLTNAVEVSDWEAQFIESNLSRSTFSDKQREIIDQMHRKYASRMGW